jgi:hypothetical protein
MTRSIKVILTVTNELKPYHYNYLGRYKYALNDFLQLIVFI